MKIGSVDLLRLRTAAASRDAATPQPASSRNERLAAPALRDGRSPSLLAAGGEAPIDDARIARIRGAVESGTYTVDPAELADALITAGLYGKTAR